MNESLDIKEYLKQVVIDTEKIFHELISWSDTQKQQFSMLLEDLKKTGKNTKEVGDKLERIVEFIVKNSFFFEIFQNVRTQTNEIDEVIVISDSGNIWEHMGKYGKRRVRLRMLRPQRPQGKSRNGDADC